MTIRLPLGPGLVDMDAPLPSLLHSSSEVTAPITSPESAPAPLLFDDPISPIHQREEACIPGTRQYVFDVIYEWLNSTNPSASKVLYLADISGSGKSAVACHIAYLTSQTNQLLGSFFFRRDIWAQATTIGVISSLSREIAALGGAIAEDIIQGARASKDAGYTEAFHARITAPLIQHPPQKPCLILIDALDESGLPADRAEFLKALIHEIPLLPPTVKVMLTSKPSQDIEDAVNRLSTVAFDDDEELQVRRLTFDVYGDANRRDLRKYISHSFGEVAQIKRAEGILLPELWPSNEQRHSLAAHANGLFLWVSVAADYMANSSDPETALEELLALKNRPTPEAGIDALYNHILVAAEYDHNFDQEVYREVMQIILGATNPLTVEEINNRAGVDASALMASLRPVLPLGSGDVVRFVHQSFRQYIRDPNKCDAKFLIPQDSPLLGSINMPGSPRINRRRGTRRQDSFEGSASVYPNFPLPRLAIIARYPHAQDAAPDVSAQIDDQSVSFHPVARGGFGDVWHALHRDGRELAIKSLRIGVRELPSTLRRRSTPGHPANMNDARRRLERGFVRELLTWSKLRHSNILELLGICVISGEIGLVSEWMQNGNVVEYVLNHPEVDRLELIPGIIDGLCYLHSNEVVHGDLKGLNVLVAADGTIKLMDFGLTVTKRSINVSATTPAARVLGTLRWMAPELLEEADGPDTTVTCESDVYALSMTILEILTGCPPFAEITIEVGVIRAVMQSRLPGRPSVEKAPQLSDSLWVLMNECWARDRSARPTARQVLRRVKMMQGIDMLA